MSTETELVALNCPNCGASLECEPAEMQIFCPFCETSVLVRDFVTQRRIDNIDKSRSYLVLAQNAENNKDWKSAFFYYDRVAKITADDETVSKMNLTGYFAGKLDFNVLWLDYLRTYPTQRYKYVLEVIRENTVRLRENELKVCTSVAGSTDRKTYKSVCRKYQEILKTIDTELSFLQPVRCKCGKLLETGENTCSCGMTRADIKAYEKKMKTGLLIAVSVLLAVLAITIFAVFTQAG